jgi:prepilin signal peptidase PulO-like enzyme (type II secretory pathway)
LIFSISFFIFSTLLSFIDFIQKKIPNITLIALLLFLLTFGFLEKQLTLYSFILPLFLLVFFSFMLLLFPKLLFGGGDIKYMLAISIYLNYKDFPIFLILTVLIQMACLFYFQKIKKQKEVPMAPSMFLSVILVSLFNFSY